MACNNLSRVLFFQATKTLKDFDIELQNIMGPIASKDEMYDVRDRFVKLLEEASRDRRIILVIDNVSKGFMLDSEASRSFSHFLRRVGELNVETVVVMSESVLTTYFPSKEDRRKYLYMEPFSVEMAVVYLNQDGMPKPVAHYVASNYSRRVGLLSQMMGRLKRNNTWANVHAFVERSICMSGDVLLHSLHFEGRSFDLERTPNALIPHLK